MLTKQGKLGLIVCVPLFVGLISFYAIRRDMERTQWTLDGLEESQKEYERNSKNRWSLKIPSIPNPFQKNISKSVYVFEYANDPVMGKYGVVYLEPKCLDQTKSIRKKEFDELLSKGVKITSSIPRKTEVTVGNLYGECVGASYILEGPENLLNKL